MESWAFEIILLFFSTCGLTLCFQMPMQWIWFLLDCPGHDSWHKKGRTLAVMVTDEHKFFNSLIYCTEANEDWLMNFYTVWRIVFFCHNAHQPKQPTFCFFTQPQTDGRSQNWENQKKRDYAGIVTNSATLLPEYGLGNLNLIFNNFFSSKTSLRPMIVQLYTVLKIVTPNCLSPFYDIESARKMTEQSLLLLLLLFFELLKVWSVLAKRLWVYTNLISET